MKMAEVEKIVENVKVYLEEKKGLDEQSCYLIAQRLVQEYEGVLFEEEEFEDEGEEFEEPQDEEEDPDEVEDFEGEEEEEKETEIPEKKKISAVKVKRPVVAKKKSQKDIDKGEY